MNNGWSEKNNIHPSVVPLPPSNVAKNYFQPNIKQVGVKISADEPDFIPQHENGSDFAFVFANIPSDILLSENSYFTMDFGFDLEIPSGYRCRAESLIPSIFVSSLDSKRFKLNLFNAGKKTVLFHKQKVAKIWIEPVYLFTILEEK